MGVNLAAVRERSVLGPLKGGLWTPIPVEQKTAAGEGSFAMFFSLGAGASVYTVALHESCS